MLLSWNPNVTVGGGIATYWTPNGAANQTGGAWQLGPFPYDQHVAYLKMRRDYTVAGNITWSVSPDGVVWWPLGADSWSNAYDRIYLGVYGVNEVAFHWVRVKTF
jgi:hypothetical protein